MSVSKKEFVLSHVIKNAPSLEEGKQYVSKEEEHFNVSWQLAYYRRNEFLDLYLLCNELLENDTWSIQIEDRFLLTSVTGKRFCRMGESYFGDGCRTKNDGLGHEHFIKWEDLEKYYMVDGMFTIEAHVEILEIIGIPRKKLKIFDETMREWSDIVLVVEDEKFYVSRLFLASHSTYFDTLLLGSFEEPKRSEVILKDVNSVDFQIFLEVLHGESAIDDNTVKAILHLADMFDVPTAHRRCEEFLLKKSKKSLKELLEIITDYNLKCLKKECLVQIKSASDVRDVLPGNLEKMDKIVIAAILEKSMSLHQ